MLFLYSNARQSMKKDNKLLLIIVALACLSAKKKIKIETFAVWHKHSTIAEKRLPNNLQMSQTTLRNDISVRSPKKLKLFEK